MFVAGGNSMISATYSGWMVQMTLPEMVLYGGLIVLVRSFGNINSLSMRC